MPDEYAQLIPVMASAFENDPILSWIVRTDTGRAQARLRFFEVAFGLLGRHELVFRAGEHLGAALWAPPDAWRLGLIQELRLLPSMVVISGLARTARTLRVLHTMESRHAHHAFEPHYYLFSVGVDPAHHGRGLGGALVRRGLAECDEQGLPAYLECSSARCLSFYRRLGFEVLEEIGFGAASPRMWPMWRHAVTLVR